MPTQHQYKLVKSMGRSAGSSLGPGQHKLNTILLSPTCYIYCIHHVDPRHVDPQPPFFKGVTG